ncbi:phosphatase PAP2 family protein [Microbispora sp. NEAU-D428]|uniref:phosphatase PAP2 family protein n=1 Tax=Microbispora sitophila TaxID=2771537 RepID=UPI001865E939|nr:phosphatase PAP2 family protein [Microbispora sitophila]MBE3010367.1 phosphatase PAP2 family protein [Microbispora sitophila]
MILRRLRLPALLVVVTGLLGAAARTATVTGADLNADLAVEALRTPDLTRVADILDVVFGPVAGVLIIALLAAVLTLTGRVRAAVLATLVVAAGWTTSAIFKQIIARPRPPVADQLLFETGHDSFPSGHVALTLSLAVAAAFLVARTRWFALVVCAGGVLVVAQAFARMYLGVHYPTDVVGSMLAATAGTSAVIALRRPIGSVVDRLPFLSARGARDHG